MRGWSFHSVKGGVGKSTLSARVAMALARRGPVTLIDLDLTGTSLADGMPLVTPELWREAEARGGDPSHPDRAQRVEASRLGARARDLAQQRDPGRQPPPREGVPYLNDWLLYDGAGPEPRLQDHLWRHAALPNLRVLPSSALPGDLDFTVPVVFDELHAGFLEARIEALLQALDAEARGAGLDQARVVVDVPPTLPGLSRAVLGVALRLCQQPPVPLSLRGGRAPAFSADLAWRACWVATLDRPDIRALARWTARVREDEWAPPPGRPGRGVLRLLVNRVPPGEGRQEQLRPALGLPPRAVAPMGFTPDSFDPGAAPDADEGARWEDAVWVEDDRATPVFSPGADLAHCPDGLRALIDEIDPLPGADR